MIGASIMVKVISIKSKRSPLPRFYPALADLIKKTRIETKYIGPHSKLNVLGKKNFSKKSITVTAVLNNPELGNLLTRMKNNLHS